MKEAPCTPWKSNRPRLSTPIFSRASTFSIPSPTMTRKTPIWCMRGTKFDSPTGNIRSWKPAARFWGLVIRRAKKAAAFSVFAYSHHRFKPCEMFMDFCRARVFSPRTTSRFVICISAFHRPKIGQKRPLCIFLRVKSSRRPLVILWPGCQLPFGGNRIVVHVIYFLQRHFIPKNRHRKRAIFKTTSLYLSGLKRCFQSFMVDVVKYRS